jgi:hypothetical protein
VKPDATWPDRSATGLPAGTPVYRIDQVETRCLLAVLDRGQVKVYETREPEEAQC